MGGEFGGDGRGVRRGGEWLEGRGGRRGGEGSSEGMGGWGGVDAAACVQRRRSSQSARLLGAVTGASWAACRSE